MNWIPFAKFQNWPQGHVNEYSNGTQHICVVDMCVCVWG